MTRPNLALAALIAARDALRGKMGRIEALKMINRAIEAENNEKETR